jgi:hypothetical protein
MTDPATVTKLDELVTTIRGYDDPRRAANEWKQVLGLLRKADVPAVTATNIVAGRDLVRLCATVDQLRAPATAAPENAPDADTCREAMRAFRKRLNLTRLDDESRLGHSPLSKGDVPGLTAIAPPVEWPQEVWQELVRQGRLRHIGHGLYELPKNEAQ